MSCVFCAIVAGDAPAIRVYEDDDYLAILDIRPIVRGHTLSSRRRTPSTSPTRRRTRSPTWCASASASAWPPAPRSSPADGNNIAINDGKAAFQSVFHIHLHVAPRHSGDKLSFAKGLVIRRDPDREATGRILREALADLPDRP